MNDPITIEAIDKRANELIDEFFKHREEVGGSDARLVYEGWMIQKVAALQIMMLEIQRELTAMKNHLG